MLAQVSSRLSMTWIYSSSLCLQVSKLIASFRGEALNSVTDNDIKPKQIINMTNTIDHFNSYVSYSENNELSKIAGNQMEETKIFKNKSTYVDLLSKSDNNTYL